MLNRVPESSARQAFKLQALRSNAPGDETDAWVNHIRADLVEVQIASGRRRLSAGRQSFRVKHLAGVVVWTRISLCLISFSLQGIEY